MKPIIKVGMKYPLIKFQAMRSRRLIKKIDKLEGEEAENRYPALWRNNLVLKRAKKMAKTLNIEVEVVGYENIPKTTALITPNHSSLFDPGLIMIALEDKRAGDDYINKAPVFLAKDDLKSNKNINGYANLINTFYLNRKNARAALTTLDDFAKFAKENQKYPVIFPSGTRSKDGSIGEYKAGAFRIAKKKFMSIVPVTINNALSITDLKRKGKLKVQVIFHEVIKPMSFLTNDTKNIATRVEKIAESKWARPEGKRSATEDKLA